MQKQEKDPVVSLAQLHSDLDDLVAIVEEHNRAIVRLETKVKILQWITASLWIPLLVLLLH